MQVHKDTKKKKNTVSVGKGLSLTRGNKTLFLKEQTLLYFCTKAKMLLQV